MAIPQWQIHPSKGRKFPEEMNEALQVKKRGVGRRIGDDSIKRKYMQLVFDQHLFSLYKGN